MSSISVALLDDHTMVREGFARLINQQPEMTVAFQCDTVDSLLSWLANQSVDVVVTDLSLQHDSGFRLLEYTENKQDSPSFIVLSMHDDDYFVSKAIEAGAKGFVSKTAPPEELITALVTVSNGQTYINQACLAGLDLAEGQYDLERLQELTHRERQLFELLARGLEVKQAAFELDMAPKTAHVHRARILEKLGAQSNFALTKLALRAGVLAPEALYQ